MEATMNSVNESMLTTVDNPYNPFTHFDEWFQFDTVNGHNTCSYLARIAKVSDELSETDYYDEVERAIDEIIKYDPLGIYIKIYNSKTKVLSQ